MFTGATLDTRHAIDSDSSSLSYPSSIALSFPLGTDRPLYIIPRRSQPVGRTVGDIESLPHSLPIHSYERHSSAVHPVVRKQSLAVSFFRIWLVRSLQRLGLTDSSAAPPPSGGTKGPCPVRISARAMPLRARAIAKAAAYNVALLIYDITMQSNRVFLHYCRTAVMAIGADSIYLNVGTVAILLLHYDCSQFEIKDRERVCVCGALWAEGMHA